MANSARLDELKTFVQSQGWRWTSGKPIAYGEQVMVTDGTHQVTINFYPKRGHLVPGGPDSPLKAALIAWSSGEAAPVAPASADQQPLVGTRLDNLKEFVREQEWHWAGGADIPYGEQIVVSDAGVTALVNFWPKRGKMQVQGPDSPLKAALRAWVAGDQQDEAGTVSTTNGGPHVGMDESGKGDWFGPLVVAAIYLDESQAADLRRLGVQDSKNLTNETILRLAGEIERRVPSTHRHVWVIEPETYNRLYEEHRNLNLLLAEAYAQVARQVHEATGAEAIVCDQFAQSPERLETAFARHSLPKPIQHHRAESSSIAVAAASILARAAFAEAMDSLGQELAYPASVPKGAERQNELEAVVRWIMESQGPEALARYAKVHFKPIRELIGELEGEQATISAGTQARPGPEVTIRQPAWRLQYHPSGFWRFTFVDGGILDWYEGSTGRLDVRGRPSAASYQILKQKADGKHWLSDLEDVKTSVRRQISEVAESQIPSVLGVGFRRRDTVLGARFDFDDGTVLNYYHDTDALSIQGKPSEPSRTTLSALLSPFGAGLDMLHDTLKCLFPDWELGQADRPGAEEVAEHSPSWEPPVGACDWSRFWPDDRVFRQAANGLSPCQRAMVADWAAVLAHHDGRRHLIAHAPTGLGKTLAALVPALAWVAQAPERRRVYYLVNRVAQHENPLRELREGLAEIFEQEAGVSLRVVDLVGQGQLCHQPATRRLPESCRQARDNATWDLLPAGQVLSWREVPDHLDDGPCPYHTLQGLMGSAHVVIADYWWLFSEAAQEGGIADRAGFSPADTILVVDEAHNLAARVRAELDVEATASDFESAVRLTPPSVQPPLLALVRVLNSAPLDEGLALSALLPQMGGIGTLRAAMQALAEDKEIEIQAASLLERALRLLLHPDEDVVLYATQAGDEAAERTFVLRLVDPTVSLQRGFSRVHASLSMSGTLAAPADNDGEMRYLVPLFGLDPRHTLTRKYASPFPLVNQRWIYCPDTLGTYQERGIHVLRYVEHVSGAGQATPGVTAVFFSSYAFLEMVHAAMSPAEQALIVAESRADAQADDALVDLGAYEARLRQLVADHGRAYLFAVYQGKLAEGANFTGNLIRTVICISIPMDYPALYHQRLMGLYSRLFASLAAETGDRLEDKVREYAVERLSLSLVLQACGRGIRHERDRCAFVLLDRRYHDYGWRRFLEARPYNLQRPSTSVRSFHQELTQDLNLDWDSALFDFVRGGHA